MVNIRNFCIISYSIYYCFDMVSNNFEISVNFILFCIFNKVVFDYIFIWRIFFNFFYYVYE